MTTKLKQDDLLAVMEDAGHRVTDARRAIVELLDGKDEGFAAEEINQGLANVGRATVFRTLKLLLGKGVLCKLISQTGAPRYAVSKFGHHHHAICVKCGSVSEFRDSTVERLLKSIDQDINGSIVGHRLELYILCPNCTALG
jgi:Fur family ferric uptake transcriptional regulator